MTKSIDEIALELHRELGALLLTRIKDGEATSAEVSNAIKWLKDQGTVLNMGGELGGKDAPIHSMTEGMPFDDEVYKGDAFMKSVDSARAQKKAQ